MLVLVLAVAASSVAFAKAGNFGIGVEGDAGVFNGLPSSALLTVKMQQLPFVLGVGLQIGSSFSLGVMADWWLYTTHLLGVLDLYVGPGLFFAAGQSVLSAGCDEFPWDSSYGPSATFSSSLLEVAPASESSVPVASRSPISGFRPGSDSGSGSRVPWRASRPWGSPSWLDGVRHVQEGDAPHEWRSMLG